MHILPCKRIFFHRCCLGLSRSTQLVVLLLLPLAPHYSYWCCEKYYARLACLRSAWQPFFLLKLKIVSSSAFSLAVLSSSYSALSTAQHSAAQHSVRQEDTSHNAHAKGGATRQHASRHRTAAQNAARTNRRQRFENTQRYNHEPDGSFPPRGRHRTPRSLGHSFRWAH